MKKILLLIVLGISLSSFGQIPTDGLVAHYPFNGNANDESSNSNNGTVNGATLTTDRFGNSNKAYSFDGIDDYIEILGDKSLDNEKVTISFWLSTTKELEQYIIYKQDNNNINEQYALSMNNSGADDFVLSLKSGNNCSNPGVGWIKNTTSYNSHDGKWHHVVFSYDGINSKIFIDNKLFSTTDFLDSPLDNCGGKIIISPNYDFKGDIDDVRIYNRELNSNEVTNLYNENVCYEKVIEKITVTDTLRIKLNVVTGIDHKNIDSEIKIYPNPAVDKINVSITDASVLNNYTLELRNTTSKLLWEQTINTSNYSIDVSSLEGKGLYFLSIFKENGELIDVRKIVLE